MDKFSPSALAYAIEQSKKDSKSLFELVEKNRNMHSFIKGKANGKKHIQLDVLQPIIDRYPKFLLFLQEGEQQADLNTPEPVELVATLRRLEEGHARLERQVSVLAERMNYTQRYIELLEQRAASAERLGLDAGAEGKNG